MRHRSGTLLYIFRRGGVEYHTLNHLELVGFPLDSSDPPRFSDNALFQFHSFAQPFSIFLPCTFELGKEARLHFFSELLS